MSIARRALVFAFLALCLAPAALAGEITVAAAADLSFAMHDLAADFQARTGNSVKPVYGSSGNFFAQIRNGAPFDVFLSADTRYPEELRKLGLVQSGSVATYAVGKIVVWLPKDSTLDLQKLGINSLLDSSIKQIAIANPRHAPYGRAAVTALQHAGLYDGLKPELVYGENVAQAAHFAASGNADAGIVALSLAVSPEMRSRGTYWVIPQSWYPALEQAAAIPARTHDPATARAFLDYLQSPAATAILERYGFSLPAGGAKESKP